MTLEAIDLSHLKKEADSEEIRAFKEKVKRVAKKYAKDHQWCEVVDQALREMGIEDPRKDCVVKVIIGDDLMTLSVRAEVKDLIDKDAEAQARVLVRRIGTPNIYADYGSGTLKVKPDQITAMELTSPLPPSASQVQGDFTWGYVDEHRSRVMHAFLTADLGRVTAYSQCGRASVWRDDTLYSNSSASAGRKCSACESKLTNSALVA